MLKKNVQYINFDGDTCEDELYFNLTEAEGIRMDLQFNGLERYIKDLVAVDDPMGILTLLEEMIQAAYGEKSEDGKHFIKTPAKTELFKSSAAYSALIVYLMQDPDEAAAFFNAVLGSTVPQAAKVEVEVPDTDKPAA